MMLQSATCILFYQGLRICRKVTFADVHVTGYKPYHSLWSRFMSLVSAMVGQASDSLTTLALNFHRSIRV